jgi:hypothetical protein
MHVSKMYLKFMITYYFLPTTATFYLLEQYINPLIAYTIAIFIWGNVLYYINMKKLKLRT